MRRRTLTACLAAATMLIVSLVRMPAAQATQTNLLPEAVSANAAHTSYYAYIPDHSIYFVDAGEGFSWAYRAIDYLAGGGVVSGVGEHLFAPGQALTRADFMMMLYRAYDMSDYSRAATFSDVPAGAYYTEAVGAAETLGIAAGSSGQFAPSSEVTREDAVVFLKRTLDLTGLQLPSGTLAAYPDAGEVSDYAAGAVAALTQAGILSGREDGLLRPGESITRAEMAALLYRALHLSGDGVYTPQPDLINLCIGDTIYTDVRIVGYQEGASYQGLVRCSTFYETKDGYFIELGGEAEINQQVTYENGSLTVDGKAMALAPDVVCIDVSPYSTLEAPVSTGEAYHSARVAVLDEMVTEIYYQG